MEEQVSSGQSNTENVAKLIRMQEYKVSQANAAILKVQQGYEADIYQKAEAKERLARHRASIAKAEEEIRKFEKKAESTAGGADSNSVRDQLRVLRDSNLDQATFEERTDLISTLGIMVYPSDDLKSMRVVCQLALPPPPQPGQRTSGLNKGKSFSKGESGDTPECGKVLFGSPGRTRTYDQSVNSRPLYR